MIDSFKSRATLTVDNQDYEIFRLDALADRFDLSRLPFSLKILLENLLRHEDGTTVTKDDIESLAGWDPTVQSDQEIAFTPARVLLQDFTGVPVVVDLAAMRDAMRQLGGDPTRINPLAPVELVIDHSVQVDHFATENALDLNNRIEFQRNKERYAFLRWGQQAFSEFKVVPPGTGIVHQVNLEYLARVVFTRKHDKVNRAYPDTVVGTDSHTTMVNGLGVLGWGVGGIEAEAAMLGQAVTMLIPQVVGFKLSGRLPEGATATDLVLVVVQMLRESGVVGKFVEFFGDGLAELPLADRATIANMAPEYGATCGIFPVDQQTLRYLALTGRSELTISLVESYARAQGLFRENGTPNADYTRVLVLDLGDVRPSLSGPKRPQDRFDLSSAKSVIGKHIQTLQQERDARSTVDNAVAQMEDEGGQQLKSGMAAVVQDGKEFNLRDGAVVIAAITSCTNTSNPQVMIGAAILARNARARGLTVKPWVKTSLAPGSKVVTDYLEKTNLMPDLQALGFYLVGYGCTTCIGNSGPLPPEISDAVQKHNIIVSSVLSGNRNFEGRIHADVRMNFLASPPLVVAYALAGTMDIDLQNDPLGHDAAGNAVLLKDIWPSSAEIQETIAQSISADMFRKIYANVYDGDERWQKMDIPKAKQYEWDDQSTYVQRPPYFDEMSKTLPGISSILGARTLAILGDSITTDHISPAGSISPGTPAARYLNDNGVSPQDFNSYGSRRGNHEVMMRGTFANVRLRNELAPGTEGGWTVHQPSGEQMTIFDAAMRYKKDKVPLIVIGGSEYGTGSSRDWAAKGPLLLGVSAVIAKSMERIHRSNLVGMAVLPLTFKAGEDAKSLGLTGEHRFNIEGLVKGAKTVTITALSRDSEIVFDADVQIITPNEWAYFEHGGILHYVVRQLAQ
ncbi:MAG: aconitate hydratase AcnA [Burkholderiaceae bacterium]